MEMKVWRFSEIYYENGWNAYIDGVKSEHFPVDYVLRALVIPGGDIPLNSNLSRKS
jgi:hypothetical protein